MATKRRTSLGSSIKRFISRNTRLPVPDRSNGDQYHYIHNFAQTTEKECILYDKENEKIYREHLRLFDKTNEKLKALGSPMRVNDRPIGTPSPNNYERLCIWRKRNEKKSVHDQSIALLYVLSKGYNIKFPSSKCDGLEAFEAITLSTELIASNHENIEEEVVSFLEGKLGMGNICEPLDDIISCHSIVSPQMKRKHDLMTNSLKIDVDSNESLTDAVGGGSCNNNNSDESDISFSINTNYKEKNMNARTDTRTDTRGDTRADIRTDTRAETKNIMTTNTPNLINVTNFHLPKDMTDNSQMRCGQPEHHNIPAKVSFFEQNSHPKPMTRQQHMYHGSDDMTRMQNPMSSSSYISGSAPPQYDFQHS